MGSVGSSGIASSAVQQGVIGSVTGSVGGSLDAAFEGNINDQWQEYITYGGLPLTVNMRTDEQKSSYLSNLFVETYLKDILERNRIKNDDELSELINILASDIGSLTNPYKLSNTFIST